MFGYSKEEVIGKKGGLLQGPDIDRRSVMKTREAIQEERDIEISLLNYRKDGTPFWILFQMCPVIQTDPHLPDMPIIVYASEACLKRSGYDGRRVLGHNCRFLSGMDTDPTVQLQIKGCIQTKRPCTVLILNYRKDGISVWNFLHVSPVQNASGKVAYFVGGQIDDGCKNQEKHRSSP
ncbi:Protein TWIN LOV 1 [Abeliophyllum distichum]|uniref:Protein TWIN LOV 1 n=1 Tax=Abeliophyllum distichum TaxID=126358 RepID=A0ABD1R821_9LAMI